MENIIAGRYNYLTTPSEDAINTPLPKPPINGPIHLECTTMKNESAGEMEA